LFDLGIFLREFLCHGHCELDLLRFFAAASASNLHNLSAWSALYYLYIQLKVAVSHCLMILPIDLVETVHFSGGILLPHICVFQIEQLFLICSHFCFQFLHLSSRDGPATMRFRLKGVTHIGGVRVERSGLRANVNIFSARVKVGIFDEHSNF